MSIAPATTLVATLTAPLPATTSHNHLPTARTQIDLTWHAKIRAFERYGIAPERTGEWIDQEAHSACAARRLDWDIYELQCPVAKLIAQVLPGDRMKIITCLPRERTSTMRNSNIIIGQAVINQAARRLPGLGQRRDFATVRNWLVGQARAAREIATDPRNNELLMESAAALLRVSKRRGVWEVREVYDPDERERVVTRLRLSAALAAVDEQAVNREIVEAIEQTEDLVELEESEETETVETNLVEHQEPGATSVPVLTPALPMGYQRVPSDLGEAERAELVRERKAGASASDLARKYRVSTSNVYNIINRAAALERQAAATPTEKVPPAWTGSTSRTLGLRLPSEMSMAEREEVARAVLDQRLTASVAARRYGLSVQNIGHIRDQYIKQQMRQPTEAPAPVVVEATPVPVATVPAEAPMEVVTTHAAASLADFLALATDLPYGLFVSGDTSVVKTPDGSLLLMAADGRFPKRPIPLDAAAFVVEYITGRKADEMRGFFHY